MVVIHVQVHSQYYEMIHDDAMGMEKYEDINGLLSAISMASVGYRVGILNSDGDEKSKCGGSSDPKYGNSRGERDHCVSGVDGDGELVNDGRGDEFHENLELNKFSHETDDSAFSV